jgi:type IV secretory pathway VirB10-like protein
MDEEARAPYQEKWREAKVKYDAEMAEYKPESVKPSGPKYDQMDFPEAPEGWTGPFLDTFLKKQVKGEDGKNLKFKDFDEAVAHTNTLDEDACVGITKTSRFYELRVGPKITRESSRKPTGLGVWVRGVPDFEGESFDVNFEHLSPTETVPAPVVVETAPVAVIEAVPAPAEEPKTIGKFKFKSKTTEKTAGTKAEQVRLSKKADAEAARLVVKSTKRAEAEAAAKAEQERLAKEWAEADAAAKAEQERLAKEWAETDAAEQARLSKEKADAEATEGDSDAEDGEDATEITIDGDTYFLTDDNAIYNPETQAQVGEKPDDVDDEEACAEWLW